MRIFLCSLLLLLMSPGILFSQGIGIGTTSPHASAVLDITSTAKGLLIPRMTSAGITGILSPEKGLMVYDSVTNQLMVNMGTSATPHWQTIVAASGWSLGGNSGTNPASNFIGTNDAQPLVFKVAGYQAGLIDFNLGTTCFGHQSLVSNTTGVRNTAIGYGALLENTTGLSNTAIGNRALQYNTTGFHNTAVGSWALNSTTTGYLNIAIGESSCYNNETGQNNVAVGNNALFANTSSYNTAIGEYALTSSYDAQYNTAIGYNAGGAHNNGYNNVFAGANTDVNGDGYYNVIAIGQGTVCTGSSQVTLGNGATGSYRAYANWSNISDGRYKKNVQENVPGLDFINQLRPVTYTLNATALDAFLHQGDKTTAQRSAAGNDKKTVVQDEKSRAVYNKALREKEQIIQTGFVAQEVEATAKKLGFDFSGIDAPKNENDVYGLRYAEFVVPLVKAVQEQQQQLETLRKQNKSQQEINNALQQQINALKNLVKK